MVTKNSTTITLTGAEQTVQFDRAYPYFWVQNLGDSDVLINMDGGIVEGADGVITVPAGGSCCTMHGYPADRLYLLGSGKVQVMGTSSAFNPFKVARKGGGKGVVNFDNMPVKSGLRVAFDCNTVKDDLSVWENSINGRPPMTLQNVNKCYDGSVVFETGKGVYGTNSCGVCVDDEIISDFTIYLVFKVEYPGSSNPYFFDLGLSSGRGDILAFARSSSGYLMFWVNGNDYYSTSTKVYDTYQILAVTKSGKSTTAYSNGNKVATLSSLPVAEYDTYSIPHPTALGRSYIYDVPVKCLIIAKGEHSADEILQNTKWLREQYNV